MGTYYFLDVIYLADKINSFLEILHALYRYMDKERKDIDKVEIYKEILKRKNFRR